VVAGRRPSMHARRLRQRTQAAACGPRQQNPHPPGCPGVRRAAGRRLPRLRGCPLCLRTAAPGDAVRTAGGRRGWCPGRCRTGRCGSVRCPAARPPPRPGVHAVRTAAVRTAAVGRGHRRQGYRTSSPGRRLPECRHRGDAWLSWRASRSPSQARPRPSPAAPTPRPHSSVSPPNQQPGRWPSYQQPMTAWAAACGSTSTLLQVSRGQARSSTVRSATNTSSLGIRSGQGSVALS
jgi:hypothetical protein